MARRPQQSAPLPTRPSDHAHRQEVLKRLRRAHGQLGAIIQMVEADAPCRNVLTQMSAVRGAVGRAATVMLRDHVKSCVTDAYASGAGDAAADELMDLLNTFTA